MQEQAEGSSGAPPDYEGRIGLDPILLDVERLVAALETGVFKLSNTWVLNIGLFHAQLYLSLFFQFRIDALGF